MSPLEVDVKKLQNLLQGGYVNWFKIENLYDDLENTNHEFELEVIHVNFAECKGTNFRLVFIGVIE